jgi:hypothetical protein
MRQVFDRAFVLADVISNPAASLPRHWPLQDSDIAQERDQLERRQYQIPSLERPVRARSNIELVHPRSLTLLLVLQAAQRPEQPCFGRSPSH